ncbi:hypothetical protein KAR91_67155 [Candidatus Pacearchaeota archaeon]|nr:hypothetical protein [Candidatus Pacearchaeota archaeon]
MNLVFIPLGIILLIGLFALIEGLIYYIRPHLRGQFAYKGLILEGILLILGALAFGWYIYYRLGRWE